MESRAFDGEKLSIRRTAELPPWQHDSLPTYKFIPINVYYASILPASTWDQTFNSLDAAPPVEVETVADGITGWAGAGI